MPLPLLPHLSFSPPHRTLANEKFGLNFTYVLVNNVYCFWSDIIKKFRRLTIINRWGEVARERKIQQNYLYRTKPNKTKQNKKKHSNWARNSLHVQCVPLDWRRFYWYSVFFLHSSPTYSRYKVNILVVCCFCFPFLFFLLVKRKNVL